MSIAGIGSHGPGNISQALSSLLSRLDATSASPTDGSTTTQATTTTVSSDSNLTGNTKPSLSGMILGTLIGLQNAQPSSSTPSDAVQNLFSAMDGDSDGSVSQSELETYLEKAGGTNDQADSLYSLLGADSQGISEDKLSSAAPPPPPPGGEPGGPHQGGSPEKIGDTLVSLIDTDNDSAVSESEYTSFVTAHGGTESDAESQFASLVSDGSDKLTANSFSAALDKLNGTSDPYAAVLNMLGNLNKSSGSTISVRA